MACLNCRNNFIPKKEYDFTINEYKEENVTPILRAPDDITLNNFKMVIKSYWAKGMRPIVLVPIAELDTWRRKTVQYKIDLMVYEVNEVNEVNQRSG